MPPHGPLEAACGVKMITVKQQEAGKQEVNKAVGLN